MAVLLTSLGTNIDVENHTFYKIRRSGNLTWEQALPEIPSIHPPSMSLLLLSPILSLSEPPASLAKIKRVKKNSRKYLSCCYISTCIRVFTTSAGWVIRLARIPAPVGFQVLIIREHLWDEMWMFHEIFWIGIPRPASMWQVLGEASILEGIFCFKIS